MSTAEGQVLSNLPAEERPQVPGAAWYGLLMPVVLMGGEMLLLVALGVALWASSLARSIFSNSIPEGEDRSWFSEGPWFLGDSAVPSRHGRSQTP